MKKFVSLFASYHQEDSVFNDMKYLQSPGSMFLINISCIRHPLSENIPVHI